LTLEEFLFETLSDDGSITVPGSPQNLAYESLKTTNPELDPNDPTDQIEITQRYALNSFYFSTDGENWINRESWTTDLHPCGGDGSNTWHGIDCDDDRQNVEQVSLPNNDLFGQLQSEIRGLGTLSEYIILYRT
jgi:hypothetical protein